MLHDPHILSKVNKQFYTEYPFTELEKHGIQPNREITDIIFRNPIIGGLQGIADTFGVFSKFLVADEGVYFVFGCDEKLILNYREKFMEFGGSVFPVRYLEKHGAYPRDGYLFMDFNAVRIDGDFSMNDLEKLRDKLALLELFRVKTAFYGLQMPVAYCLDSQGIALLLDARRMTDNTINADKSKWHDLAKAVLRDLAVYEWPIRPDNKEKCGFQAFLSSDYCPDITADKLEQVYDDTRLWDLGFQKKKTASVKILLYKEEAEYVSAYFRKNHLPFIEESVISEELHSRFSEAHKKITSLTDREGFETDELLIKREFIVFPRDAGLVSYLRYKFVGTKFTPEEHASGLLWKPEDLDGRPVERFVFYLPHKFLEAFRSFAKVNHIRIGYTDIPYYNKMSYFDGVNLVAAFDDMPIIEQYLHNAFSYAFSMHEVSLDFTSPKEERVPAKYLHKKDPESSLYLGNPTSGFYVKKHGWRPEGTTIKVTDSAAGKTQTAPSSSISDCVEFLPYTAYDESGRHSYSSYVRDKLMVCKNTHLAQFMELTNENEIIREARFKKKAHEFAKKNKH